MPGLTRMAMSLVILSCGLVARCQRSMPSMPRPILTNRPDASEGVARGRPVAVDELTAKPQSRFPLTLVPPLVHDARVSDATAVDHVLFELLCRRSPNSSGPAKRRARHREHQSEYTNCSCCHFQLLLPRETGRSLDDKCPHSQGISGPIRLNARFLVSIVVSAIFGDCPSM